jgi:mono/diheme cytochrome c family protein
MLKLLKRSLILAFTLSLSACQPRSQSQTDLGKAYFRGMGCFKCHQIGNEGAAVGPDLTMVGFRKTPQWIDLWLKDPVSWKKDTVMPRFYLKDNVRGALVAYLASLKGQDWKGQPPWNAPDLMNDPVKRGERLYNRLGCVGCHGKAGRGGYPNNNVVGGKIPSLTLAADGYSKDELKKKISQGVPKPAKNDPNGPEPMVSMPSWGQVLKDDELNALVEYLYSLRPAVSKSEQWE